MLKVRLDDKIMGSFPQVTEDTVSLGVHDFSSYTLKKPISTNRVAYD
jgi:hypothetical protein